MTARQRSKATGAVAGRPAGRSISRRAMVAGLALAGSVHAIRPVAAEPDEVDLLLVLAADISRSIDDRKFRLQRQGYAAALTHRRVLAAIESGAHGRIAVCFLEWSGVSAQIVLVDWTTIATAADADRVASRILETPRTYMDRTAIGAAIDYAMVQVGRAPYKATRRVIDISGDGTNTHGIEPAGPRDSAVAQGVVINGVVILSDTPLPQNPLHTHPPGGLLAYYEKNVIGGPGSFALPAEGFEVFGDSLISKLVKEISSRSDGERRYAGAPSRTAI